MYRVTERDHRAAVERPLEPPLGRGRIVVNPLITGTGTLQDSMKSFLTAVHSQRLNCSHSFSYVQQRAIGIWMGLKT